MLVKLPKDVVRYVAQQHKVVGIVRVGVPLPDAGPFLDGLADVDARILDGKVQDGGGAAEQGRPAYLDRGRCFQVPVPHDGSIDMSMGFNAPGHYYLPRSVNDAGCLFRQGMVGGHCDDLFSLDRHVPVAHTPGRNYLAIADYQVKHTAPPVSQLCACAAGTGNHCY